LSPDSLDYSSDRGVRSTGRPPGSWRPADTPDFAHVFFTGWVPFPLPQTIIFSFAWSDDEYIISLTNAAYYLFYCYQSCPDIPWST
jgi:hypothetical protein